jgi:hypothetical protein
VWLVMLFGFIAILAAIYVGMENGLFMQGNR